MDDDRRKSRTPRDRRRRSKSRNRQPSRTYRPPHQSDKDFRRSDLPQNLYVVEHDRVISYDSQQPMRSPETMVSSPTSTFDDATSYRLASNPYHGEVHPPSPHHRAKLRDWYQRRFPVFSRSISERSQSLMSPERSYEPSVFTQVTQEESVISRRIEEEEDKEYLRTKQSVAVFSILLTSIQLLVLMMQLTICGLAPWDVNGFVGPYPDAFSEWGGKNAYLILKENEWWRLGTSSLLHVGLLHLVVNAFCQLEAVALFEREWGSFRWLLIYLISSAGSTMYSCFFDPDTIAVSSSGALLGMYGAKLAQVITVSSFELNSQKYDRMLRMEQLSSVLIGMTVLFLLSAFTYIDWSGHLGGITCGFFTGIIFFSNAISSCCAWFFWVLFSFLGLVASLGAVSYFFVTTSDPDADIGDACEYFRGLFPEDYDCGCLAGFFG